MDPVHVASTASVPQFEAVGSFEKSMSIVSFLTDIWGPRSGQKLPVS